MSTGEQRANGRIVLLIGMGVILMGLLLNEITIAYLFSRDGILSFQSRIIVRAFMSTVIILGAVSCFFRYSIETIALRLIKRFPNSFTLLIGLGISIAGFIVLELGFHARGVIVGRNSDHVFQPPSFKPGASSPAKLTVQGQTIYDVIYTLEHSYARATPAPVSPTVEGDMLFFGGSFTFGEGVQDDESLPAIVARHAPAWRVANFGFPGHGPAHMLTHLSEQETLSMLEGPNAKLVYVFIPGHVRRVIGSMRVATTWGRDFPYYAHDPDRGLIQRGTFATGRPVLTRIYGLLNRERILGYYGVDIPTKLQPDHIERTAQVIEKSRDIFAQSFSPEDFHVVIYPRQTTDEFSGRELIPYLEDAGIQYLDYTDAFGENQEGYWLEHDQHPTAKAHRELGEILAGDLFPEAD